MIVLKITQKEQVELEEIWAEDRSQGNSNKSVYLYNNFKILIQLKP